VESADPPLLVFAFWPLLSQWLGQNWPWLCLLGAVSLAFIFRDWLLEQPAGRFWIVPAALLPASITFARDWDQQAPAPLKGCIVPILLLAVAVLQLYGQERNERYRKTADDAVKQQGIVLRGLADTVEVGVESVLAAIQGGAGNDIEVEASKQTEGRDEELGDPAPSSKLEATAKASKQTIYEDTKRRIQQNIPISSQLKEAFLEDTKTASLLKVDYREKYDEDDENFLEYLRDDYENWIHKFLQAFSITEPHLEGSLKTRWPLFTGLIGTSYNFGVDWTREHESLIIPEENINKLVDSWILKLNLNSRRDDEMYPYLKNAIESSIRFGVQKSISDLLAGPQRLPD
jgi:hypothetical protein